MIVGVVIDQDGRPVCSEMWPGDTTDVTTLIPVIDRGALEPYIDAMASMLPEMYEQADKQGLLSK